VGQCEGAFAKDAPFALGLFWICSRFLRHLKLLRRAESINLVATSCHMTAQNAARNVISDNEKT
jgi:hypothetical protein